MMMRAGLLAVFLGVAAASSASAREAGNAGADAAIDAAMEQALAEVGLNGLAARLSAPGGDPLARLHMLYQNPDEGERLNQGFANLPAAFDAALTPQVPRPSDCLARELDERLGAGAFALMRQEQQAIAAAEERALAREDTQIINGLMALEAYVNEHGEMPPDDWQVETR